VYDYEGGKQDWLAFGLPRECTPACIPNAGEVATREVPTCRPEQTARDALDVMSSSGWTFCLVVNQAGIVVGRVRRSRLPADESTPLVEVMEPGPGTYRPSAPLEELVTRMKKMGRESLIISDPDGRLWGLLSREAAERVLESAGAARGSG
jgi:CBS domain-containing protein